MNMTDWTITRRIVATCLVLTLLLLTVGTIGTLALRHIETLSTDVMRDDAIPGVISMTEISNQTLRAHIRIVTATLQTDPAKRTEYLARIDENNRVVNAAMDAYEKTVSLAEDRANFTKLEQIHAQYSQTREKILTLLTAGQVTEAQAIILNQLDPLYIEHRTHTWTMLKWNQSLLHGASEDIITSSRDAKLRSLLLSGFSILTAIALGWFVIRGVNHSLHVAAGTLDEASQQLASAASQVSSNSQSLAAGTSEQAASLEETSSSLEELSSMTKRNAESAQSAKQLSTETRHAAETGHQDMSEMRTAMDAIKSSSNDISKIIKTIDEIAFQTNILALNAAVEAARAGEAGSGFAVVADEVRALAQRSAQSAKETAEKIEVAIRNGDQGVNISGKVAHSLGLIVEKARRVDEIVGEIATASQEQTRGIDQINSAVSQMDKVTQSNAGNAEETAAAAEQLNAQSCTLKDTVGQLRQLVGGQHHAPAATTNPPRPPSSTPPHSAPRLTNASA